MKTLYATGILSNFVKSCAVFLVLVAGFYISACKETLTNDKDPRFEHAILKRLDTANNNKYADYTLAFLDSSLKALPHPGRGDIFFIDSIKLTIYRVAKHDYLKSLAYLDSMMALAKDKTNEEKYAERYAIVLYERGQCFIELKRYNEAFHYISQAELAVHELVKNKCNIDHYSSKIAYLLFAQERYIESAGWFLKYYNQSLSSCYADTYDHFLSLQRSLNNIGLCYLQAGMLDSAAWYENAALNTISANEKKYPSNAHTINYMKSVIYGDQAAMLARKRLFAQAEDLFKKSISGTSAYDIGNTQIIRARLADVYLDQNKTEPARLVLEQLKSSLDSFPNEKQLLSLQKLYTKYYSQKHQVDSAFSWQQQYTKLSDSAGARDKKFENADLGKEFENLELKYSNEVLQKESKLKNLYLVIALFTFISATVIAWLIWKNLKRIRKLHMEVEQKNKDMQNALSALEQSHDENNRIIRIVAHDLKSPISAINNLIFTLLRKDYPSDLKETFQLIKAACGNSMGLINDALYQKKNAAVLGKELVDMKRLLEYCVDLLQSKADEKNQQLILHAETVLLMMNRQRMWRVVSNILNNAIKFSPEYAVIDINLKKKERSVLLSVHDNGIGIPQDLQNKIFTMSPDASRTGTFGEESHGLGLSITRKIVEEHEGKIWFKSIDGEGSVFYVELPYMN